MAGHTLSARLRRTKSFTSACVTAEIWSAFGCSWVAGTSGIEALVVDFQIRDRQLDRAAVDSRLPSLATLASLPMTHECAVQISVAYAERSTYSTVSVMNDFCLDICNKPNARQLAGWDSLVAATSGSDVSQLSSWGRLRATVGYQPLYVFAYSRDQLVGGAQILCKQVPLIGRIAWIPFGPLITEVGPTRTKICNGLGEAVETLGKREFRAIFVRPSGDAEDVSAGLLCRGFRRSDLQGFSNATLRLDLSESEMQLRARLSRRLRYWTSHWSVRGVTVRKGVSSDVGLLVELMQHTGRHHGYRPPTATYVDKLYRELSQGGHVALFIGELNEVPVVADLLTVCGGIVKGQMTGFDRSGEARRLSVPAAVRWHAIRWAKYAGYQWFDFGGINARTYCEMLSRSSRSGASWPTVDRAKISFGGTPYQYPPLVELIHPAVIARSYDLLRASGPGRHALARMQDMLRGTGYRRRS
jgi:hypothetical protein